MELKPVQSVFIKEVTGNVWKTGVIDQPAKEPESYWIKFPGNSILRRTRSRIKPRSQPSYFDLEAESKEWNDMGTVPPHSHYLFISKLQAPKLLALPMSILVLLPLTSRATQSGQVKLPVSFTGEVQPSITSSGPAVAIPSSHRSSTCSIKGIPPVRFTLPRSEFMCIGTLWKPVERLFC